MTPEETYKLAAILAAQRFLIRELLILSFARLPDSANMLKTFVKRLKPALDHTTVPKFDPAQSDVIAQEMADIVNSILAESEEGLAELLKVWKPL
jgi:hypothetical protein